MSMMQIWIIILVIALIIEAITVDLVSIWFALGALIAIVLELLHIDASIQLGVFLIISITSAIITRPLAKKILHGHITKTNLDRLIGKHCIVLKDITPDQKGEIKVMGNTWLATSLNNEMIYKDEYAQIIAIEGAHVIVKKIEKEGIL